MAEKGHGAPPVRSSQSSHTPVLSFPVPCNVNFPWGKGVSPTPATGESMGHNVALVDVEGPQFLSFAYISNNHSSDLLIYFQTDRFKPVPPSNSRLCVRFN